MAGELNNAACFFSPFGDVNTDNMNTPNGSLGEEADMKGDMKKELKWQRKLLLKRSSFLSLVIHLKLRETSFLIS